VTYVRASCQARLQEAQELQAEAREVGDPELSEEAAQAVQRIEVGASGLQTCCCCSALAWGQPRERQSNSPTSDQDRH
jgi:hypothetical protein